MNANNNREVMRILPAPLAHELFAIGWQASAELCCRCRTAQPRPSIEECANWISAARRRTQDETRCYLWLHVERGDDDYVEWVEEAALRLGWEGFETGIREGGL